jgi:Cu2+-containing amine oxidase
LRLQDPSVEFYYKSYFDGGDIGLGSLSKALVKGIDCPENAYYYNGVDAGFDGFPRNKKNMVCVFERNPEEVLWRHTDTSSPIREVRSFGIVALRRNAVCVFGWKPEKVFQGAILKLLLLFER